MMAKNERETLVIGVLGGMGTYATIHLFRQYAECFNAEKEWDRPRIIIDNRCTMPSRVRAFLYNESTEQLIDEMIESIQGLLMCGATRIILDCNTSHLFLPEIFNRRPEFRNNVVDAIQICAESINEYGVDKVYLLASEGTIESGIYQNKLSNYGISCFCPDKEEYVLLRKCIEAVKQCKYDDDIEETFIGLINRFDSCVLGCTELPILYERYCDRVVCNNVFDPMLFTIQRIRSEYYGN